MVQTKPNIYTSSIAETPANLDIGSKQPNAKKPLLKEGHKPAGRDESEDGFWNKVEFFILTHFKPVWRFVQKIPLLERIANRVLISRAVLKIRTRPHPHSLMADYTSWDSLTDRTFTGRHLEPAKDEYTLNLPDVDDVVRLFEQQSGEERLSETSTQLFSHFAQWFTDGFLRTDRIDHRKNTSNHQIDLSPVYGLNREKTCALRTKEGGRLKSQIIAGGEFPPFYFDNNGNPKKEFEGLDILYRFDPSLPQGEQEDRKKHLFAMGVERANIQFGYVMLNTLFLREHNRLCSKLSKAYPDWDDERWFQTARNTVIVMVIKIVIEDYLNHIAPYHFSFKAQPRSFHKEEWYRNNWMTMEFNLLYRWHGLVTKTVRVGNTDEDVENTLFNNKLLLNHGLASCFDQSSRYPCGTIGLFNTQKSLREVDKASIELGRKASLQSYNAYRKYCGYPAVTEFNQITGDPDRQDALKRVYGHPDNVEFYAGLFSEDTRPGSPLSPLIGRLVGIDAFSQALTNPLLSEHVYNEGTFSSVGWSALQKTKNLSDVVHRNLQNENYQPLVTFTYSDHAAS